MHRCARVCRNVSNSGARASRQVRFDLCIAMMRVVQAAT